MNDVAVFGQVQLEDMVAHARDSVRRRRNFNLHRSVAEPCNRLFNAIEPGSYIRPHRHVDPAKDETFIVVQGRLGLVIFDADGAVAETHILAPRGTAIAANIAHGVYHTIISLEPGTVVFEAKGGPYAALSGEERAPWAPDEDDAAEAARYLTRLAGMLA